MPKCVRACVCVCTWSRLIVFCFFIIIPGWTWPKASGQLERALPWTLLPWPPSVSKNSKCIFSISRGHCNTCLLSDLPQCISQLWCSALVSRWPVTELISTCPTTPPCGENCLASKLDHPKQCAELLCFSFIWCRPPGSQPGFLHPWLTINLVVALLVGLAWISVAIQPQKDYTEGFKQEWTFTQSDCGSSLSLPWFTGSLVTMEVALPRTENKAEMTTWGKKSSPISSDKDP